MRERGPAATAPVAEPSPPASATAGTSTHDRLGEYPLTEESPESTNVASTVIPRPVQGRLVVAYSVGAAAHAAVITTLKFAAEPSPLPAVAWLGFPTPTSAQTQQFHMDSYDSEITVGCDGRVDPDTVAAAITDRTAMVVVSAPCYPYGVIDPVADVAAMAAEHGVLCHVDACLGGFLLPFWAEVGEPVPPWDFRVDGVTSLSADIHKYGWCFKGASLLLHRDEDMLALQYFLFDGWPGGLYGSATTAGTRPAAPIAAAWATISHLGMDGYLRLAERVREASAALRAGVAAVPGLRVTGYPVPGVLEIAADESVDIGAVADVLEDRGWHLDRQQGGLHAIVSPSHVDAAPDLLADLADAVARHGESRGVEARYGGIG